MERKGYFQVECRNHCVICLGFLMFVGFFLPQSECSDTVYLDFCSFPLSLLVVRTMYLAS